MDDPLPVDDLRPPNRAILWRRVPLSSSYIVLDDNTGTYRVSSGAFDDPDMSVAVTAEAKKVDYLLIKGYEDSGIVAFTAGFARGLDQTVIHDPWPAEPAHALVIGHKPRPVQRAFAKRARWVHRPPGYDERTLPDPPDPPE